MASAVAVVFFPSLPNIKKMETNQFWLAKFQFLERRMASIVVDALNNPFDFLPKGFLERTKGLGFVVPSWGPQIQVLGHASTGGFLTHCGWNSTLESIVNGVPLIAWPLYAEQRMNAVMLDDMKLALRVKSDENGLILREEIARVVKELMKGEEGKAVRNKTNDLKEAAKRSLSDSGSSTKSLSEVATKWRHS